MKKMKKMIVLVLATMLLLTACGAQKFTCGFCMKQVKQVPHKVSVFGAHMMICDYCYNTIKGFQ